MACTVLPPVGYLVVSKYHRFGVGSHDITADWDQALDHAAESMAEDRPFQVLRITDTLNCDDVTEDVIEAIERRAVNWEIQRRIGAASRQAEVAE